MLLKPVSSSNNSARNGHSELLTSCLWLFEKQRLVYSRSTCAATVLWLAGHVEQTHGLSSVCVTGCHIPQRNDVETMCNLVQNLNTFTRNTSLQKVNIDFSEFFFPGMLKILMIVSHVGKFWFLFADWKTVQWSGSFERNCDTFPTQSSPQQQHLKLISFCVVNTHLKST